MGERRVAELVQRPRAAWHARPGQLPGPRSLGGSCTRALRPVRNSGARPLKPAYAEPQRRKVSQ